MSLRAGSWLVFCLVVACGDAAPAAPSVGGSHAQLVRGDHPAWPVVRQRAHIYARENSGHAMARSPNRHFAAFVGGGVRAFLMDATGVSTGGVLTLSESTEALGIPSAAFDGTNFVVAWETVAGVFLARVSEARDILNPEGVLVAAEGSRPRVACAGGHTLLSFERGGALLAQRFDASLASLDAEPFAITAGPLDPSDGVALAATTEAWHVFWDATASGQIDVYGRSVTVAGDVGDVESLVQSPLDQQVVFAAARDDRVLLGYRDLGSSVATTQLRILDAELTPLGAGATSLVTLAGESGPARALSAAAAADGSFLVAALQLVDSGQRERLYVARVDAEGQPLDASGFAIGFDAYLSSSSPVVFHVEAGLRSEDPMFLSWTAIPSPTSNYYRLTYASRIALSPLAVTGGPSRLIYDDYIRYSNQKAPVLAYNGDGRFLLRWIDNPKPWGSSEPTPPGDLALLARIVAPDQTLEEFGLVVEAGASDEFVTHGPPFPASLGGDFGLFFAHTWSMSPWENHFTDFRTFSAQDGTAGPIHPGHEYGGTQKVAFTTACAAGARYFAVGYDAGSISLQMAFYAPDGMPLSKLVATAYPDGREVSARECVCGPTHCVATFSPRSGWNQNHSLFRVDLADDTLLDEAAIEVESGEAGVQAAPNGDDFVLVYRSAGHYFLRELISTHSLPRPARHLFQSADNTFRFWNDGAGFVIATWSTGGALTARRVSVDGQVGAPEVIAEAGVVEAVFQPADPGTTLAVFTRQEPPADYGDPARLYARWLFPPDADAGDAGAADASSPEAGTSDAGVPELEDAGFDEPDAAAPDAGSAVDASTDSGTDAGEPGRDAGSPHDPADAGPLAAQPDAGEPPGDGRSGCTLVGRSSTSEFTCLVVLSAFMLRRRRQRGLRSAVARTARD